MRRRSRVRRITKWAGTVACLILGAAWALSYSPYVLAHIDYPNSTVLLLNGRVHQPRGGRTPQAYEKHEGWRVFRRGGSLPALDDIYLPLWIPTALVAAPAGFLWYGDAIWWWRNRRPRPGHCQTCGYDLTGNVSGRCPECGTPLKPENEET